MIIKNIKISNILSYPWLEDFTQSKNTINFNNNLNILIGSNGSGKSNLVEIIHQLFSKNINKYYVVDKNRNHADGKIIFQDDDRSNSHQNITKHHNSVDKDSRIEICIQLDSTDRENLSLIYHNWQSLEEVEKKYSSLNILKDKKSSCSDSVNKLILDKESNLSFSLKFNLNTHSNKQSTFSLVSKFSDYERLIYDLYLCNFLYIQKLISVAIEEGTNYLKALNHSMFLIPSNRQHSTIPNNFDYGFNHLNNSIKESYKTQKNNSAKKISQTKPIFDIVICRILFEFRKLKDGNLNKIEALKQIHEEGILKEINDHLKKINIKLEFDGLDDSDQININFIKFNNKILFDDLSSGEKNFLYLVMSFFTNDFGDGIVLIDEPELHLHLSMQKKFYEIVLEISGKKNLQIIISTHSSVFVSSESISKNSDKNESTNKVFRFFKDKNGTQIINPQNIDNKEKDLIQILSYTNSSRIFFCDDVLLVEGPSDEYFFSYFYKNYNFNIEKKDLEIINIGGKSGYKGWMKFLTKFGIRSYFIGDLDNVLNMEDIVEAEKINTISNKLEINDKNKIKSKDLIQYFYENDSCYTLIKQKIDEKYKENIFILKSGEIEEYTETSKNNKMESMINFCHIDEFNKWIIKNNQKLEELIKIFIQILEYNKSPLILGKKDDSDK